MNQYVLARKDFLNGENYECPSSDSDMFFMETSNIKKANRYSLDDALSRARIHKQFGRHYIVKRVEK